MDLRLFLQNEASPHQTQSLSAVPLAEHAKKALKKGVQKGGVKNFTPDDWKEECLEWSEAEWRVFRLK